MRASTVLLRAAGFLALWLVLAGVTLTDLPASAVAVVAAAWVSLRLAPPAGPGISLPDLAMLIFRFPGQALIAGIDVARRVFDPRLPLNVDTIAYTPHLPEGPARDAFAAYASLMPGTIPVSAGSGGDILIHCLDISQPVAAQMRQQESRFIRMLGYRND